MKALAGGPQTPISFFSGLRVARKRFFRRFAICGIPANAFFADLPFAGFPQTLFFTICHLRATRKRFFLRFAICGIPANASKKIFAICKGFANASATVLAFAKLLQTLKKRFRHLQRFCKRLRNCFGLCKASANASKNISPLRGGSESSKMGKKPPSELEGR